MTSKEIERLEELCIKYVTDFILGQKLNKLCGGITYCQANMDRFNTHQEICDLLNVKHTDERVKKITDDLESALGINLEYDYNFQEEEKIGKKLAQLLLKEVLG